MMKTSNPFIDKFIELYGKSTEDIRIFFAPGRVNLIGEHTDYNGGNVFPAALSYGIWVYARKRDDHMLHLRSLDFDTVVECDLRNLQYKKEHDWANYPKGVVHELIQLGVQLKGVELLFYGNIPNGAGLSSSASIELVTAIAIQSLFDLPLNMIELVKLSQRAENNFVGVNCGIMDQFAVGMGKEDHAIFLNCQTMQYEHVPMDIEGFRLVIANTNKRRGLADSKYNERRNECEQGVKLLQQWLPSITSLGDVSLGDWELYKGKIENETIRNRVTHVIEENHRVLEAIRVINQQDTEKFGQLMLQSHHSLRDLYEVTGAELDTLFDIARQVPGCIGTRMTGAGFGGCTVSIVREDKLEEFKRIVHEQYEELIGYAPSIYVCDIGSGAREITQEVEQWPY
jgi:galactokinase